MNRETRVQFRNRKRKVDFDTSRTLIPLSPKQRRRNSTSKMNTNTRESQITDLSTTIITNRPSTSNNVSIETGLRETSANNSVISEEITPEVRDLVVDEALSVQKSLQEQIRTMVQGEMEDVKKSIGDLMKIVKELSQNTTRNNNNTIENNQTGSNNSSEKIVSEPQIIEVTQLNPPIVDLNAMPGISQYRNSQTQSEYNQNRTPNSTITIPAPPPRNVYSNLATQGNYPNINGQHNTNFLQNNNNLPFRTNLNNNDIPSVYTFGNYNPQNVPPVTNTVGHKDMPHMSVEDFIFHVERLQAQYEIPMEELERDFHLLLSGPAKEWYWLFVQTHFGVKWPGLKQALISQYQTSRSNFEIMRDLNKISLQ